VAGTPDVSDDELSFVLWNNGEDEAHIIMSSYGGGKEVAFPGVAYELDTLYYVEMSVDGRFAVVTVRQNSHTGPVVTAMAMDDAVAPPMSNDEVEVADVGNGDIRIEDMRLSQYVSGL
jgi:hypothetical protein